MASPAGVASGYRPALATAAGLSALGAITTLALSRRVRSVVPERRETGEALQVRV